MTTERLKRHTEKWNVIYRATAKVRAAHPAEFKQLREGKTYPVALRLLRERYPDEYRSALGENPPTSRRQPEPRLRCDQCGDLLGDHSVGQCL
jgi:hypothetical protein